MVVNNGQPPVFRGNISFPGAIVAGRVRRAFKKRNSPRSEHKPLPETMFASSSAVVFDRLGDWRLETLFHLGRYIVVGRSRQMTSARHSACLVSASPDEMNLFEKSELLAASSYYCYPSHMSFKSGMFISFAKRTTRASRKPLSTSTRRLGAIKDSRPGRCE